MIFDDSNLGKSVSKEESGAWNPRYAAYAKAHGRTPEAQLEHDVEEFPGGCMCGFMLWIGEKKLSFREAHPEAFFAGIDGERRHITDHRAWDRWLGVEQKEEAGQ